MPRFLPRPTPRVSLRVRKLIYKWPPAAYFHGLSLRITTHVLQRTVGLRVTGLRVQGLRVAGLLVGGLSIAGVKLVTKKQDVHSRAHNTMSLQHTVLYSTPCTRSPSHSTEYTLRRYAVQDTVRRIGSTQGRPPKAKI